MTVYAVWKVWYMTYAEIEAYGDRPSQCLNVTPLSLDSAIASAVQLGGGKDADGIQYRHSVKPA